MRKNKQELEPRSQAGEGRGGEEEKTRKQGGDETGKVKKTVNETEKSEKEVMFPKEEEENGIDKNRENIRGAH